MYIIMCRNIPKDMGAQNMDNNKLDFFVFVMVGRNVILVGFVLHGSVPRVSGDFFLKTLGIFLNGRTLLSWST